MANSLKSPNSIHLLNKMTLKLTAVHLVDEGSYLVKFPYNNKNILVSGVVPESCNYVVVSSLDEIVELYTPSAILTHYTNDNDPTQTITPTIYQEQVDLLRAKGEYDDFSGELVFTNLDDEYAYKKFIKTWNPFYVKQETIKRPVEIEITEIRTNSGDPDIVSLWNSPALGVDRKLYSINRLDLAVKTLRAICGDNNWNLEIPTHSGILYAKINNSYVFRGDEFKFATHFIGTLEQSKSEKARIIKRINDVIAIHNSCRNKIDKMTAGYVLGKLRIISDIVQSSTKSNISMKINDLINDIQEEMIKE